MAGSLSTRLRIGTTDLAVPPLGLGTVPLGGLFRGLDDADATAVLQTAWDEGIRYFDTAPWYGRGLAEHRTGAFLHARPRDAFVLTTKVGRILKRPRDLSALETAPWPEGLPFEVHFDYGYDGIMRAYEQSQQRLALPAIDALIIHDLDALYHDAEAIARHTADLESSGLQALDELKRSGDIAAYGIGINTHEALEMFAGRLSLDFMLVAMPYTLLDQTSLHAGMATCVERGVSVIVGAPFASGILATGSRGKGTYDYRSPAPEVEARVTGMEEVCAAHGVSLPAAALQFPLAHPAVVSVIPGTRTADEVQKAVHGFEAPIPPAFWAELEARELIHPDAPVPEES